MVSDEYFCVFQIESWSKSLLTLIFWSNFHSLITIRKKLVDKHNVKLYWRQQYIKNYFVFDFEIDSNTELVELIINKMEKQHINYK